MAALILSQGLLQNLIGYKQMRDGQPTGIIEIVAGGRRLEAMNLLLSGDLLTADFPVHYILISVEEAIAFSLAENSGREDLHPADTIEAMQGMITAGKSIDVVSTAFGITALTTRRRLKLASMSPRLFDMFREGQVSMEQMMALSLTDDHALQEGVWDNALEWQRQPNQLRHKLTMQEVSIDTDPVARYVGLKAYEKAGGIVRRDLFSDKDTGYVQNPEILETLALAKLNKAATALEKEGFAWVQVHTRMDHQELNNFGRPRTMLREPTAKEKRKESLWVKVTSNYSPFALRR